MRSGFIVKPLCSALLAKGFSVRAIVRDDKSAQSIPAGAKSIVVGDMASVTDWVPLLTGVDVVVHLAARVHVLPPTLTLLHKGGGDKKIPPNPPFAKGGIPENLYQKINVDVTRALAFACSKAGVRRFIFVSSVKAIGELTERDEAWNESTRCMPKDAYGHSKLAAEKILVDISKTTGLEVVILRFPLVYGSDVKANMARLIKVVKSGIPLPFGSVKNKRSLLYVGNAVDSIRVCLEHPAARGETFLVSDGKDVSTPDLIRHIASSLERPARLFPFPPILFRIAGKVLGQSNSVDRLLGSLVVDSSKIQRVLSWRPPYSLEEGLGEVVR